MSYLHKTGRSHVLEKIGYQNDNGEVVINEIYDNGVDSFGIDKYDHNPYGVVSYHYKYGAISEQGDTIIPFDYDEVIVLFDNLFAVRKGDFIGVINDKLDIIIPSEYKYIRNNGRLIQCFKEADIKPLYIISNNGACYECTSLNGEFWYNEYGHKIYEGCGESVQLETILITNVDSKLGCVNNKGEQLLPNKYDFVKSFRTNRFIVGIGDNDTKKYGVVDETDKCIINVIYNQIEAPLNSTFIKSLSLIEDSDIYRTEWFNLSGKKIFIGDGEFLADNFIAVKRNKKFGIYDNRGNIIANFLYDEIKSIDNFFIVKNAQHLGILDNQGKPIISTSYLSIECVNFDNYFGYKYHWGSIVGTIYGQYSNEFPYDTTPTTYLPGQKKSLKRKLIQCNGEKAMQIAEIESYNFGKIFILETENYFELFSVADGILPNSQFDKIEPINDDCFVVKKGNKYGVYQGLGLCIKCEYDRIQYFGGDIVFVQQNDLWGVQPISYIDQIMGCIDIPTTYLDIKLIKDAPFNWEMSDKLFGAKHIRKSWDGKEVTEYTIINAKGEELNCMKFDVLRNIESQFTYYNNDRILCSKESKFGFISLNGYVSIPFKYDEVEMRSDGLFNVRIEGAWGLLELSGKEIVPIKYINKIPAKIQNAIVTDAKTMTSGVLNCDGSEKIPSIYDHCFYKNKWGGNMIIDNGYINEYGDFSQYGDKNREGRERFPKYEPEFIYIGYGDGNRISNNFFTPVENAIWGCMNVNGKEICPIKYDCFIVKEKYILAGRDGSMLGKGQIFADSYYEDGYSGVYDLYDKSGQLLIGGFNNFEIYEDLLFFRFGGKWETFTEEYDYENYVFNDSGSKLLITDKSFESIIKKKNGEPYKINKGFIGTITTKNEDGKIVNYWNMPLECLMSAHNAEEPCGLVQGNFLLYKKEGKTFPIRISDKKITLEGYDSVSVISDDLFYIEQKGKDHGQYVGLANIDRVIIPAEYCLVTKPVSNLSFAILSLSDEKYSVYLYDFSDEEKEPLIAIKEIDVEKLYKAIRKGLLMIDRVDHGIIYMPDISLFDMEFSKEIQISAAKNATMQSDYYLSEDPHFSSDYKGNGEWVEHYDYCDENQDDDYDILNDAFEGEVDLYNEWLNS